MQVRVGVLAEDLNSDPGSTLGVEKRLEQGFQCIYVLQVPLPTVQ